MDQARPLLLSVNEAAKLAGIGRGTAYDLVQAGEWRAIRLGRLVKIPEAEVGAWVQRRIAVTETSNGPR